MLESGRAAAGTLKVTSPFDGRELAELPTGDAGHVDDAMAAAHALFRNRDAWLPIPERVEILNRAAELMASVLVRS